MRNWAATVRDALAQGKVVQVQARGHSMSGRIEDGDLVTLAPCDPSDLTVGDIVLVTVEGRQHSLIVLHRIHEIGDGFFLIGNNQGRLDGWVSAAKIHGRVVGSSKETDV